MKPWFTLLLLSLLGGNASAGTRSGGVYGVTADAATGGGGQSAGGLYANVASLGEIVGTQSAANPAVQIDAGLNAQVIAAGAVVLEPEIQLSTMSLGFGNVTQSSNSSLNLTISNLGTAELMLSSALVGAQAADFSTSTVPTTVAAGGQTTVTVTFTPSAAGLRNATLQLTSNDMDEGLLLITFSGTGVLPAAPTFTSQPQSQLLLLGSAATFGATVIGQPVITYQWRKGTAKIAGALGSQYTIPTTKAADAGIYSVVADNPVGDPVPSESAYLALVTLNQGRQVLKRGATLTLKCTVAAPKAPGVEVKYSWRRNGDPIIDDLPINNAVVTGADKATLTITKTETAHSGNYTCLVSFEVPGDDPPSVANGDVEVQVVDAVPVLNAINLPTPASVSQSIEEILTATNAPTAFTVANLPKGLKLDAKTGRITGKPTAPSKKDALGNYIPNKITFKASNPIGAGPAVDFLMVIQELDGSYIGTFNGVVGRSGASNFGLGGHVQVTVGSTGVVSGSATLAGQKHGVAGVLDISVGNEPTADLVIKRAPASLGNLLMRININLGSGLMQGRIFDERFEEVLGELVIGDPEDPDLVDGSIEEARFNSPRGIAILPSGSGYIADTGNHVIRFVDGEADTVMTFAGNGTPGFANDTGTAASFNGPEGLALDAQGNLYVADTGNSIIRKITPAGVVTTFAGAAGQIGSTNGTGAAARFSAPGCLCFDPAGNLYVTDRGNHLIRKITPAGVVTTLAGKASVGAYKDGSGVNAVFHEPRGITYDPVLKALFVADRLNRVVRKVTLAGAVSTYAGSPGVEGDSDGLFANTRFVDPIGIASVGEGILAVLDGLLVQLNPNGTACTVSERMDTENFLDRPVAGVMDPTEDTFIVVHDRLHSIFSYEGDEPFDDAHFDANRNPWTTANTVPTAEQGLYNAVMETTVEPEDTAYPLGDGYAQVSISKNGTANWTGKAADGTSFTFGTILAVDRSIPLHASLYKNTGSLQGECFINTITHDIVSDITPAFDWYKIPQPLASKDRYYKGGFITHDLEVTGGKYIPNDIHSYLGLPAGEAAMQLSFVESQINPFTQAFTITPPNKVGVPANAKGLTMKIDPKTGLFSGSFKEGSPQYTVNFAGILLHYQNGNARRGFGHYLIPESSSATALVRSWRMSLTPQN